MWSPQPVGTSKKRFRGQYPPLAPVAYDQKNLTPRNCQIMGQAHCLCQISAIMGNCHKDCLPTMHNFLKIYAKA